MLSDGEKSESTRKSLLKNTRRVVVKIGSGVLTGRDGLNRAVINDLSDNICALKKKNIEFIVVSSV